MPTLEATFETRREAEMSVERLVQQFKLDRKDIVILADGPANSAGEDAPTDAPVSEGPHDMNREDAALNGRIRVSVQIEDAAAAADVRAAFAEFDGEKAHGAPAGAGQ